MILLSQPAVMEFFLENNDDVCEQEVIMDCAWKMLENIELQIQVTYDYHQLKALYHHKEVINKMIKNCQEKNSSAGYG